MKRGKRTCRKANTNIRMEKQFASGKIFNLKQFIT
nr:MAG TPA: hypothetical protein [Caudoviricetes sp.]